jgi:PhzF family phenazine biosynthesis protein
VARLHLLRVFCDEHGAGGNPLAVFLDGRQVPASSRQDVAADLGLSETVFVDDAERGDLRIFTPTVELSFAGHPTVGTAWLLAAERAAVASLQVPAGELGIR